MLIIVSDCQFTRLALTRLLAHLDPVNMSVARWLQTAPPAGSHVLLAASPGMLASLVPACHHARTSLSLKLALLGSGGQAVFLNTLGLRPDCLLPRTASATQLKAAVSSWLRRARGWRQARYPIAPAFGAPEGVATAWGMTSGSDRHFPHSPYQVIALKNRWYG